MPQDRLRHQRAGHSQKLTALTDFEYRVWDQYQLSADDFGIMRYSPLPIQAGNDALSTRPGKLIQKALDRLLEVGLVKDYEHQGARYICDPVWQYYQKIEYPKQTINPPPPADVLADCHPLTAELFRQCFGRKSAKFLLKNVEDSSKSSREPSEDSSLTRARAHEEARANGSGQRQGPTGSGAMGGALPREHLKHVACDPTYSRCVPQAVHDKLATALAPKYAGDRQAAKDALQAWYPTVWQTLADDFVMPDAFRFWQARFDAQFATKDATPGAKSSAPSADQTAEYLRTHRAGGESR
jgi:hypothetical protein